MVVKLFYGDVKLKTTLKNDAVE